MTKGLLGSRVPTPTVLVFACNWCTYAAADLAGLKRLQMNAFQDHQDALFGQGGP